VISHQYGDGKKITERFAFKRNMKEVLASFLTLKKTAPITSPGIMLEARKKGGRKNSNHEDLSVQLM